MLFSHEPFLIQPISSLALEAEQALRECTRHETEWEQTGVTEFLIRADSKLHSTFTNERVTARLQLAEDVRQHPTMDAAFVEKHARLPKLQCGHVSESLGNGILSPLVQAASVTAECGGDTTLAQAALLHRGMVASAWLPLDTELYRLGLNARHSLAYYEGFLEATILAVERALRTADRLTALIEEAKEKYEHHRATSGRQRALREDAAESLILASLPASPLLSVRAVIGQHNVSSSAAKRALEELHAAGILADAGVGKYGAKQYAIPAVEHSLAAF